jgi:hypothetical protein
MQLYKETRCLGACLVYEKCSNSLGPSSTALRLRVPKHMHMLYEMLCVQDIMYKMEEVEDIEQDGRGFMCGSTLR